MSGSLAPAPSLAAALLLSLGIACSGSRSTDPVILALGDQVVRRSEFERHLRSLEAGNGPLEPSVRRAVLDSFLEQRVLVLEARARGLVGAGAASEAEQAAVAGMLAEQVFSRVEVEEAEIAAYFAEHAAEFRVPETVTLRQILLPTENEARQAQAHLQRDPRSFELLARTTSRAPEASTGGLMGTFSRGQLPPELEAVAFALREGASSETLRSPLGFHVLRLEARRPAREPGIEECREQIRSRLAREKGDRAARRLVQELITRAKVDHEAAQVPAAGS